MAKSKKTVRGKYVEKYAGDGGVGMLWVMIGEFITYSTSLPSEFNHCTLELHKFAVAHTKGDVASPCLVDNGLRILERYITRRKSKKRGAIPPVGISIYTLGAMAGFACGAIYGIDMAGREISSRGTAASAQKRAASKMEKMRKVANLMEEIRKKNPTFSNKEAISEVMAKTHLSKRTIESYLGLLKQLQNLQEACKLR